MTDWERAPVKKALEKAGETSKAHIRDLRCLFKTEAPCISGIRMEGVILARGAVKIRMEVDEFQERRFLMFDDEGQDFRMILRRIFVFVGGEYSVLEIIFLVIS